MTAPLLEVEGLTVTLAHGGRTVALVAAVDLAIGRGETLALVGESGCGKTMVALALMRLLPGGARISAGAIRLGGSDLTAVPERAMRSIRGRRLAMIFQEPHTALNPVLTIGQQIGEVVRLQGAVGGRTGRSRAISARVVELLTEVGLPDAARRAHDYPHQLSGGMRQRAMIAMALAGRPQLLIADEPTTALDVTIQAEILALLRGLQRQRGMSMLLITHDFGVVAETADRLAVMYAGEIVETASVSDFFAAPAHPYSCRLLASRPRLQVRSVALGGIPGRVPLPGEASSGCRFVERCDLAQAICHARAPPWRALARGRGVHCHLATQAPALDDVRCDSAAAAPAVAWGGRGGAVRATHPAYGEEILRSDGLAVHFPIRRGLARRVVGQVRAVDGVSLVLRSGQTLALVGESGCGKTTVGRGLLQLVPMTGGTVHYQGRELGGLSSTERRKLHGALQIVFQDPYGSMNPRLHIGDIVGEGLVTLGLARRAAERRRRVGELLERVGLSAQDAARYPYQLSGGQRQRVGIARALAVAPRLVVCDEPTSALDVSVQAQILSLLRQLQHDLGLAYLFITHDLAVVAQMADEIAVMYLGRIVERGRAAAVLQQPRHPYTKALLSAVPVLDRAGRGPVVRLAGERPSPARPPPGCHFHPRCPDAVATCAAAYPSEIEVGEAHRASCARL